MLKLVLAVSLALPVASIAQTALADCDTGFEYRETKVASEVIPYFVCVPGGEQGDPDLGWHMMHVKSPSGAEVRAYDRHVELLRAAGVVR